MKEQTSSEELLTEISKKLDTLIAFAATQGLSTEEKIRVLKGLEYPNTVIGRLTGMSEANVRAKLKKK